MIPSGRIARNWREAQKGSFLIMGLLVSLVISLLLASAIITVRSLSRNTQFTLNLTDAAARADGVTEAAQKSLLTRLGNMQLLDFSAQFSLGSKNHAYQVRPVGQPVPRIEPDGAPIAVQRFKIHCRVEIEGGAASVTRLVEVAMVPIFQHMIFYGGDLEIHPGASMTLNGRVHSNGNIYLGSASGNALTINTEQLWTAGDILRQRKDTGVASGGTVRIKVFGESNYKDMDPGNDSANPDWLQLAEEWKGTVQSSAQGVKEVSVPEVGSIKAFDPATGQKGYYHQNAGLVLRDGEAFDQSGAPVLLPPGTVTEKTLYDARESKSVRVTEVNMALLNSSGKFPQNGLLYAYRTDASPSQPNGIRLTNGGTLAAPLTVVTEDPLYIKGDFNTVNQKGAAVIADSVNLLSNSWNDSKRSGTLPSASRTRYNLAMIAGHIPTPDGGGGYSGGFENLPHFHENWSGVSAIIRGAFVSLFSSEIGRSPWRYGGDVYTAPIRDWGFDPQLSDPTYLPPFTPIAFSIRRLLWDDDLPSPLVRP